MSLDSQQIELDILCKKILDHPSNQGCFNFDVYNIFRIITSKKIKNIDLSGLLSKNDQEINAINQNDFKSLVLRINPFYKFHDHEKNLFYILNFILAQKIVVRIEQILKNKNVPDKYFIFDIDGQNYMNFSDLGVGDSKKEAVFKDLKSCEIVVFKYLDIYNFLHIKKELEIHSFNMDNQLIDKKSYVSYSELDSFDVAAEEL
jgi:hypothetical protein